jgi:hypothetical protein
MKQKVIFIVILAVSLVACDLTALLPAATLEPTGSVAPAAALIPLPTSLPSPKPEASADPLRQPLQELVASPYWPALGLPPEQITKWPLFASGQAQLPAGERAELQNFLEQWAKWNGWLASARMPTYEKLAFRVRQLKGAQAGPRLVLYGLDELSTQKEGAERIYLPSPVDLAKPKALILAPRIAGLRQQISADGQAVEYIDGEGQPLLAADAFRLWNNEIGRAHV